MTSRCWILTLCLVGAFCFQGIAALTFTDLNHAAGFLNPGDVHIVVQRITIQGDVDPTLINAVTVQNLGTATSSEITRIELTDGTGTIGYINNPVGLNGAGITILTNYLVPVGRTITIYLYVDVASVESVVDGDTLALRTKFHYGGMTDPLWVVDGVGEEIRKAGFETFDDNTLGDQYFNPTDVGVVQSVHLFDTDANASPVMIRTITVWNTGSATVAEDVVDLELWVNYNGDLIPIPRPSMCRGENCWQLEGIVFDPVPDLRIDDGTGLVVEVIATIAGDPPTNNRTIRPAIEVELEENGQIITQYSLAPSTQTIRMAGIEEVLDQSVVPTSHALATGEVLTQELELRDRDVNANDVEVTSVYVRNSGAATAEGRELQEIIVRRGGVEIGRETVTTDFHTTGVEIPLTSPFIVPDNGDAFISVNYVIGTVVPGHTLQPVVTVEAVEPYPRGDSYWSEPGTYPEAVYLYPAGLEIIEDLSPPEGGSCYTGQRLLAQKIRCVDRDENRADVVINPIVVRNRGTASGNPDVVRIEIETLAGDPLGEETDLSGFETGGVTITTLENNLIEDHPTGNELVLCIYVTVAEPEEATVGNTIQLETTIFHAEDGKGYSGKAEGSLFEIEINHRPEVDFTFDPTLLNIGDTVSFTPTVTDADGDRIVTYLWEFGDPGATTSDEEAPSHAYDSGGTFTVTLTATDSKGLSGFATKDLVVNRPPTVDFDWTPEFPDLDETAEFTPTVNDPDDPDDTPFTYEWDFDDGTTSGDENPTHEFSERKTYEVTLTVTDARRGSTSVTKLVTVGNRPPEINFTWTPTAPQEGQLVTFTATVTDPDDPDDTPFEYEWDFDDGETSTAASPTHTFDERRSYTIALSVTDARGGRSELSKILSVGNQPPVADFNASPTAVDIGEAVQFTDTSTDPDGTVEAWLWDFDDGLTSTEQDPAHTYRSPGTYTVSLVVTDDTGIESVVAATAVITVRRPTQVVSYAYPNPASTETTIVYYLPEGATDCVLRIYDLTGALVHEQALPDAEAPYNWNLKTDNGQDVPNGVYFYVITAKNGAGKTIKSPIFKILVAR
jgi:PKD repeat protein